MATTRKKPATATKAAAATRPAKKAGNPSLDDQTLAAATATALAEPPAPRASTRASAQVRSEAKVQAKADASGDAKADAKSDAKSDSKGDARSSGPSGIERRRSPREKMVAPAVLQPSSGDASVDRGVQVQDLSLGGVGFVASEKFDPGEVYRITLGKGPLLLNARVKIISCNKTGHRMYRCGAEFC